MVHGARLQHASMQAVLPCWRVQRIWPCFPPAQPPQPLLEQWCPVHTLPPLLETVCPPLAACFHEDVANLVAAATCKLLCEAAGQHDAPSCRPGAGSGTVVVGHGKHAAGAMGHARRSPMPLQIVTARLASRQAGAAACCFCCKGALWRRRPRQYDRPSARRFAPPLWHCEALRHAESLIWGWAPWWNCIADRAHHA